MAIRWWRPVSRLQQSKRINQKPDSTSSSKSPSSSFPSLPDPRQKPSGRLGEFRKVCSSLGVHKRVENQIVEEVEKLTSPRKTAAGQSQCSPRQLRPQTLELDPFLAADFSSKLRRVGQSLAECKQLLERVAQSIQHNMHSQELNLSSFVTSPVKKPPKFLNDLSLSVFKNTLRSAHHTVQSPGSSPLTRIPQE